MYIKQFVSVHKDFYFDLYQLLQNKRASQILF